MFAFSKCFQVGTPIGRRERLNGLGLSLTQMNRVESETDNKFKQIMKQSGILTINGIDFKTDIKDLDDLGELGNGTSGHVVKMKHKPTKTIIAVKVKYNNILIKYTLERIQVLEHKSKADEHTQSNGNFAFVFR